MAQEGADFEIPGGVDNIKIAKSRVTPSKNHSNISDNDARTLAKEIRQAKVLTDRGASVFKMYNVVNDPKYTGGFKGDFIFSVKQGRDEIIYHMKIMDLK